MKRHLNPMENMWLRKTAGPLAAQRYVATWVAASVVRDGDRLDGRGSGGDAPAVAGARTRLVA